MLQAAGALLPLPMPLSAQPRLPVQYQRQAASGGVPATPVSKLKADLHLARTLLSPPSTLATCRPLHHISFRRLTHCILINPPMPLCCKQLTASLSRCARHCDNFQTETHCAATSLASQWLRRHPSSAAGLQAGQAGVHAIMSLTSWLTTWSVAASRYNQIWSAGRMQRAQRAQQAKQRRRPRRANPQPGPRLLFWPAFAGRRVSLLADPAVPGVAL